MVWLPVPPVKQAVLKTLAYADVFDFPLTAGEIERFLISSRGYSTSMIRPVLRVLPHQGGFYFLPKRRQVVAARSKKAVENRQKMALARRLASRLKLIPTVKMIAVTGALAMGNATPAEDIDILIVSRRGTLWLTRLLVVFLAELMARRRRPDDQQAKDKLCLNMFLDEDCLALPAQERNLYTAHEVVQAKLLWDRDNTYQKFLNQNLWYQKYLANWKP